MTHLLSFSLLLKDLISDFYLYLALLIIHVLGMNVDMISQITLSTCTLILIAENKESVLYCLL